MVFLLEMIKREYNALLKVCINFLHFQDLYSVFRLFEFKKLNFIYSHSECIGEGD